MSGTMEVDGACALILRGERLAREGALEEAEIEFTRALAIEPRSPNAVVALARVQVGLRKVQQASATIDSLAGTGTELPAELQRLRGQLLVAQSRYSDAVPVLRAAVAADSADGQAEFGLAVALGECGLDEEAATAAGNAIAKGHDNAGSRFALARALFTSGRYTEALAEFRQLLRRHPLHDAAHANFADLVWMLTGDVDAATAELDAALRHAPSADALRIIRSRLLDTAGRTALAYSELATALSKDPRNLELHLAASQMILMKHPQRALAHAERAMYLAAADVRALRAYIDALLATGHAERVVEIADALLEMNADDGHAIAMRASAWRLLGDPRYRDLYDYGRFVRASLLDTPQGWPDLASYLDDLAKCLHARHDPLRAHPVTQTLRNGTQVLLSKEQKNPAISAFPQAIAGPIRRYLDALGVGNDPLRRRATDAFEVNEIWSVRLRRGGFHSNHYHGKGWISSACYIEIPEGACATGGSGWLRFGEPRMRTAPSLAPEYCVRPEPGLLVLFPSWMWHGTMPFNGRVDERRLTVAFDVVPAATSTDVMNT
ncbi:MAG: putative 2OG-Fe(II) oxygenase [Rhodanobacteraceae bacterium]